MDVTIFVLNDSENTGRKMRDLRKMVTQWLATNTGNRPSFLSENSSSDAIAKGYRVIETEGMDELMERLKNILPPRLIFKVGEDNCQYVKHGIDCYGPENAIHTLYLTIAKSICNDKVKIFTELERIMKNVYHAMETKSRVAHG